MKKGLLIIFIVIFIGVVLGIYLVSKPNKDEVLYLEKDIYINSITSYEPKDMNVHMVDHPCDCLWDKHAGYLLPEDLVLYSDYGLYLDDEDSIHDYVFEFYGNEERKVKISYSTIEEPFRDYIIESTNKVSKINDINFYVYQYEGMYIIQFYTNDKYYDLEINNFSKEEMIKLVEGIIN